MFCVIAGLILQIGKGSRLVSESIGSQCSNMESEICEVSSIAICVGLKIMVSPPWISRP